MRNELISRRTKWNKAISTQEKRAKNLQKRRDADKNIHLETEDFQAYMTSQSRQNAASLFQKKCQLAENISYSVTS